MSDQAIIEFREKSDPEANGRKPLVGETRYTMKFPLDDGRELQVHMGREGCSHIRKVVMDEFMDEQFEISAPSSRSRFHDARALRLKLAEYIGPQDAEVAADIEALLERALEDKPL